MKFLRILRKRFQQTAILSVGTFFTLLISHSVYAADITIDVTASPYNTSTDGSAGARDDNAPASAPVLNAKTGVDAAIAAAKTHLTANPADNVVLYFPAGTYHFEHPGDGEAAINLFDFNNGISGCEISVHVANTTPECGRLVLRGDGVDATKLVFHNIIEAGILIDESRRVTVEQMHLTRWDTEFGGLYSTQGVITNRELINAPNSAVDANDNPILDEYGVQYGVYAIEMELDEGYTDPKDLTENDEAAGNEQTIIGFRYVNGDPQYLPSADKVKLTQGKHNEIEELSFVELGNGLYKVHIREEAPDWMQVGVQVAVKAKNGIEMIRVWQNSDDALFQDLLITRSSGNAIRVPGANKNSGTARQSDNAIVRRVIVDRIGAINGKIPYFSQPGGGFQLYMNTRGATIQDSEVHGTGDDAFGLFSDEPGTVNASGWLIEGNILNSAHSRGMVMNSLSNGILRNNLFHIIHDSTIKFDIYDIAASHPSTPTVPSANAMDAGNDFWEIYNNVFYANHSGSVVRFTTANIEAPLAVGDHHDIEFHHNTFIDAPKNSHLWFVENVATLDVDNNTIVSFSTDEDAVLNLGEGENDPGNASVMHIGDGDIVNGTGNTLQVSTVKATTTGSPNISGSVSWTDTSANNGAPVWIGTNYSDRFTFSKADAMVGLNYSESLGDDALDPDGDSLTYIIVDGPAWLGVNNAATGDLSGTPSAADVGLNRFLVRVTDGDNVFANGVLEITVCDGCQPIPNNAPVFTNGSIDMANATQDVAYTSTLDGLATDADGDSLTYSKTSGPTWLNVAGNGALSGIPETSDVGANAFTVQVVDGNGGSDIAVMNITVDAAPVSGFTELFYDDFENDLGNWNDGGADASLYTGGTFSPQGDNAANIQEDGSDATILTNNLALAGKTEIKVEFTYQTDGMDSNEEFRLQLSTDAGDTFQSQFSWEKNVDFSNGQIYSASVIITGITLNDQTQLRFRNYSSANSDDVYIDEIRVSVK